MKKTRRIFPICLSIFLILCTMLTVIGIAASTPKKEEVRNVSFTSLPDGFKANIDSGGSYEGVELAGKGWIGFNESHTNDNNKYLETSYHKGGFYNSSGATINYNGKDYMTGNAYLGLKMMSPALSSSTPRLNDFSYLTLDFDFMSETGEYFYGMSLAPLIRAYGSDGKFNSSLASSSLNISLTKNSTTQNWKIGSADLNQGKYAWNHLSYVMKIQFDETNSYTKSTCDIYLNGVKIVSGQKLFSVASADSSLFYENDISNVFVDQLRISFNKPEADAYNATVNDVGLYEITGDSNFSFCVDNIVYNTYEAGYSAEPDTVFDGSFPMTQSVACIDGEYYLDDASAISAMATAKESIEIFKNFTNSITIDKNFRLITNGYTLSYITKNGFYPVTVDEEKGIYDFVNTYSIFWHVGNTVTEEVYVSGEVPTPPVDIPEYVVIDGFSYKTLGGWASSDGAETAIEIPPVSAEVHYYPTRTSVIRYYSVTHADGSEEIITSENATLDFGADIIGEITDTGEDFVAIKLLSNVVVGSPAAVPTGKTVYLDVNGFSYTYTFNSRHKYNSEGKVTGYDMYDSPGKCTNFTMGTDSNLYLYSSTPGGKFFNSLYHYGFTGTFTNSQGEEVTVTTNPAVNGLGIVMCGGSVKNSNLYIGDVTYNGQSFDGDNLSTYAANIIYHSGDQSNNVYISGGQYYKSVGDSRSLVVVTSEANVRIKDALLASESYSLFSTYYSKSAPKTPTVFVDNCVIYTAGQFFSEWHEGATLHITNSYVYANISIPTSNGQGDVIIGNGVRLLGGKLFSSDVDTSLVTKAKTSEMYTLTLNFNKFSYTHNEESPKDSVYNRIESETLTTVTRVTFVHDVFSTEDSFDTITWKFGNEVIVEHWFKGLIPRCPFDIPEKTEYYYFDAGIVEPAVGGQSKTYEFVQKNTVPLLMNVSLYSDFIYNIYIPLSYKDRVTSIEFAGADYTLSETDYYNGTEYYVIRKEIPASSGAEEYTLALSAIGYNSDEFTQNYIISIPRYAEAVLDGGYNDSAKALMRKVLSYVKSACEYFGTPYGSIGQTDEIIPVSGKPLGSVPDSVLEVFSGAQLSLGAVPKFRFNVSSSATFNSATFNSATFTYYVNGAKKSVTVYSADLTTDEKGNRYYEIALKAKDMQSDITVTVNGESFAYNLANYIYNTNNNPVLSSNKKLTNLLYSLWAYSQASLEYVEEAPVVGIQINGNSVEEYKIVAGTVEEQNAAAILRNQIYLKTGILLDVVTEYDGKAIIIKMVDFDHNAFNDFSVTVDENNLIVKCAFKSFVENGIIKFCDDYIKKINNVYNFTANFVAGYVTNYVSYYDCGAVGDGVADDFNAMYLAHQIANAKGYLVKVNEGTYNVGAHTTSITVQTDVDWTGATIIIDDSNIAPSTTESKQSIFTIAPQYASISLGGNSELVQKINAAGGIDAEEYMETFFDYAPGYKAMIFPSNADHKVYIRYGGNANDGGSQRELIIINEDGTIDQSTRLLLDYEKVTGITVYRIDDDPITILGGTLITIANQAPSAYTYYARNFSIKRSNTTFRNVEHKIQGELDHGAPYSGFFGVSYMSNLLLDNCKVQGHRYYPNLDPSTGGPTSMGTYEIGGSNSNNLYYKDCVQTNFFDDNGNVIASKFWGVMGSNYCKNITYDHSTLSRLDAHSGVLNATIKNGSKVTTIALIGGGTALIEDSTVYSNGVISLRNDYGSTWYGDIILRNTHIHNSSSSVVIANGSWANHYFGYTTHLPTNLVMDNVTYEKAATVYLFANYTGNTFLTHYDEEGVAQYINISEDFDFTQPTVTIGGVEYENRNPMVMTETVTINNPASNVSYLISSDSWVNSYYESTTTGTTTVYKKKD